MSDSETVHARVLARAESDTTFEDEEEGSWIIVCFRWWWRSASFAVNMQACLRWHLRKRLGSG
jgi:hypothetical protein